MLNLIITIPSKLKVCHLMLNCSYWYVYALRLWVWEMPVNVNMLKLSTYIAVVWRMMVFLQMFYSVNFSLDKEVISQSCCILEVDGLIQISIASVPMLVSLLDLSFKFSISTLNCVKLIIPWKWKMGMFALWKMTEPFCIDCHAYFIYSLKCNKQKKLTQSALEKTPVSKYTKSSKLI